MKSKTKKKSGKEYSKISVGFSSGLKYVRKETIGS